MAWTDEQLAAMTKNSGNLLVAAGAGSGKTAVLIERVLGIITDEAEPVDVDDLLILTYTNAAAAEMRQRLVKALRGRLNEQPDNPYLNRQLVLMQRSKIMTIHSFCLDLLKEYGYMIGLDPKTRIGNEGELGILRERVLDEVFEAAYNDEASGLKPLLAHYCRGVGDENLRALVLRLITFGQSMPDTAAWLNGLAEVYRQGQADKWLDYFASCLQSELNEYAELLRAACRLVDANGGLYKYLPLLTEEAEGLTVLAEKAAEPDNLPQTLRMLAAFEFKRLPAVRVKGSVDEDVKNRVQQLRNRVKDGVADLLRESLPVQRDELADELAELEPMASALVRLAADYYQAWQQAKRRAKLWEFADLEHYALQLLQDEKLGVGKVLRQRFFEILVDEYQDINEVQETLLSMLSNGENRFMVGDIKQSIYRFRLAEPTLFMGKFAAYGQQNGGKRIDLNKNFRSQAEVLAGVNFVFSQLMMGGNLEIVYDEAAVLHCGREELAKTPCELLIIDKQAVQAQSAAVDDEGGVADDWLSETQTAELEAHLLAEKMLAEHEAGRPWGDMAVLLRSAKTWAPIVGRVLTERGVPSLADGREEFLSLPEVQVVSSLLAVLDNPRQDIALAAVLHSPLVGLKLAELADLRLLIDRKKGECLYDGLKKSHDSRLVMFLAHLDDWRQKSREKGVYELLEYIYNATALPELLGSIVGGKMRRRNLAEIERLALEYDRNGGLGLTRFLRFLEAAGKRLGQQDKAEEADAVRLMTIHKSKGLEFPLVFVVGLNTAFNEEDFRQDILLHRTLGLGMRLVEPDKRRKFPTFGFNIITRKARWESLAEALRVLYVAMTRAENKLVLVGTVASAERMSKLLGAVPEAENTLNSGFLLQNRAFLPWVAAALLRHKDGGVLRNLAGWQELPRAEICGGEGGWQIELVQRLNRPNTADGAADFDYAAWLAQDEEADTAEIKDLLARKYPAAELAQLPIKWSATAFKRLEAETIEEDAPDKAPAPGDVQAEFAADLAEKTGRSLAWYAEFGKLTHALLEKADLAALNGGEDAAAHLQSLLAALAEDYAEDVAAAVQPEVLAEFFYGELGRRLLAAAENGRTVLREQRFIANVTLAELIGMDKEAAAALAKHTGVDIAANADEALFFQGVIDLAFAEEDGWVMVDYKSGRNERKTDDMVRAEYGLQLAVYRQAAEEALRQPVKEGFIYFTANGRAVKMF